MKKIKKCLGFLFVLPFFCLISESQAAPNVVSEAWRDYSGSVKRVTIEQPDDSQQSVARERYSSQSTSHYFANVFRGQGDLSIPKQTFIVSREHSENNLRNSRALIRLEGGFNCSNRVIDFNDSTLFINGSAIGMSLVNCNKVVIKNLHIVYNLSIASLAKLYKKSGRYGVQLEPDYRELLNKTPAGNRKLSKIWDANPNARNSHVWSKSGGSYAFNLRFNSSPSYNSSTGLFLAERGSPFEDHLKTVGNHGAPLVAAHYSHETNGIRVTGGSNITLSNIKQYGVPGMAFYIQDVSTGVLIEHSSARPATFLSPLAFLGTAVDGIHLSGSSRNVLLRNNYIKNSGDDGINVYGSRSFEITNKEIVNTPSGKRYTVNGEAYDSGTNDYMSANFVYLGSDNPSNGRLGVGVYNKLNIGDFVNVKARGSEASSVLVRNNRIHGSSARGMLIQSSNSYVANNDLKDIAKSGISVTSDTAFFMEGERLSNIKLYRNTINNVASSYEVQNPSSYEVAAIHVGNLVGRDFRPGIKPYGVRGSLSKIWVSHNVVKNSPNSLGMYAVQDGVIAANNFTHNANFQRTYRSSSAYNMNLNGPIHCELSKNVMGNNSSQCR